MGIIDDAEKNWLRQVMEEEASLEEAEESMVAEEVEASLSGSFCLNKRRRIGVIGAREVFILKIRNMSVNLYAAGN